jgi:hypothetical protein
MFVTLALSIFSARSLAFCSLYKWVRGATYAETLQEFLAHASGGNSAHSFDAGARFGAGADAVASAGHGVASGQVGVNPCYPLRVCVLWVLASDHVLG